MAKWLYPLSQRAGFYFVVKQGTKRVKVSLDNYRKLVQNGKLREDAWWYVYQNYEDIEKEDEIYLYFGDKDTGIVGYAKVKDKRNYGQSKEIRIKVDLDRCRMLVEQPIPAPIVRRWIPFPRAAVISLDRFQKELSRYLPWGRDFDLKPTVSEFKKLNLKPRSRIKISSKVYQRKFVHDTLLEPVADLLKAHRFRVGAKSFGKLQVDLVGLRNSHLIITEGKTNKQGFGRREAREAFGQLNEYRWHFTRTSTKKLEYVLWVVFQRRPEAEIIEFLEDNQFLVSWIVNKSVRFSGRSNDKFKQLRK